MLYKIIISKSPTFNFFIGIMEMRKIQVVRSTLGMRLLKDANEGAEYVLSVKHFDTWIDTFTYMRDKHLPITAENEEAFKSHPSTQFKVLELVNYGYSASAANVYYDVREVEVGAGDYMQPIARDF